jgi:hypothetical protein
MVPVPDVSTKKVRSSLNARASYQSVYHSSVSTFFSPHFLQV